MKMVRNKVIMTNECCGFRNWGLLGCCYDLTTKKTHRKVWNHHNTNINHGALRQPEQYLDLGTLIQTRTHNLRKDTKVCIPNLREGSNLKEKHIFA